MRQRSISPRFFTDPELIQLPPLTRLLFQGLWCVADREGRLLDEPGRLRLELFPGEKDMDVNECLDQLAKNKKIVRYEVEGVAYIQVCGFLKYQNPHIKEAPSKLPGPKHHAKAPCSSPAVTQSYGNSLIRNSSIELSNSVVDNVDNSVEEPLGALIEPFKVLVGASSAV